MDPVPLALADLRGELIRLEESIIFALIERSQWRLNPPIYQPGAIPLPDRDGDFADYLLYLLEAAYARVRRYTSPDEHPFHRDLPPPVLPAQPQPPRLVPNDININPRIHAIYRDHILPRICRQGDDGNYGSSATCDAAALQAISKRIHYGKFVAEAKFQQDPEGYSRLIRAGDRDGIMAALTDHRVEQRLLKRILLKGMAYGRDIDVDLTEERYKVAAQVFVDVYRDDLIPLTKDVEVQYLMVRLRDKG